MNYVFIVISFAFLIPCICSIDLTQWELFEENVAYFAIRNQIMWKLDSTIVNSNGYRNYLWDNTLHQWKLDTGISVRIALDQNNVYCCHAGNQIFRKNNHDISSFWTAFDTCTDVKVGSNNHVWIVTASLATGGYQIKKYDASTTTSTIIPGGAIKIAPTPDGNAWGINSISNIMRWDGSSWSQVPGTARDIVVGNDGIPLIVSTVSSSTGYEIHKWNETLNQWVVLDGIQGVLITLDSRGNPYVVTADYKVYRPMRGVLLDFCPSNAQFLNLI